MIDVLYAGYSYTHERGLNYDTDKGRSGFESYQLLFTHTPALFFVDGTLQEYPARSVIMFTPGHRKYYTSLPGQPYTNDWIRFNTDEDFISDFPIKDIPFQPMDPDFVHDIIKLITWESNNSNNTDDPDMLNLFKILFNKMGQGLEDNIRSPYHPELLAIRREMQLHPELNWTVSEFSSRLKLGKTRTQILYKETFGISCIDDVIETRIKLAKDRLLYTSRSVAEIAESCGYKSTEHFLRQFSKYVGKTPGKFRREGK